MRRNKAKSFQFELVGTGQQTLLLKQIQSEDVSSRLNTNLNIIKNPKKNKLNKSYMCHIRKQFAEHQLKRKDGYTQKQNLSVDQIKDTGGYIGVWPKLIYQPNNYEQKRFKSQPVQQIDSDGFCFPETSDVEEKIQISQKLRFPQINDKRHQFPQAGPNQNRKNLIFNKIMYPQSIYMQGKAFK